MAAVAPDATVVSAGANAVGAIEAAVIDALRGALGDAVTGVFASAPPRAAFPYVLLGESASIDWGTKDVPGREVRLTIDVEDEGEGIARLGALAEGVEEAIADLPREVGGWRIASLVPIRSRRVRRGERRYAQIIEFRARLLRAH